MNTSYGFTWGPLTVTRIAHNDGKDKRAKWWCLEVKTDTQRVEILLDHGKLVVQGPVEIKRAR